MCEDECMFCKSFDEPTEGEVNEDRLEQENFGVFMEER